MCICYEVAYLMLSYSHTQGQNNEPRAAHLRSEQVAVAVVQSNLAKSQAKRPARHGPTECRNFTSYPSPLSCSLLTPPKPFGPPASYWHKERPPLAGDWQLAATRRDSSRPDKKLNHIWTSEPSDDDDSGN